MKVTLQAKSDSIYPSISIEDFPFVVGRDKSPFAELREQSVEMKIAVSFLSRKHAVISSEQGRIYLADMGSVNGTKLNNRVLGKAQVKVCNGDQVIIGEHFHYTFSIEEIEEEDSDKTAFVPDAKVLLTLIPADQKSGLDTVTIQDFPFIVSRSEGFFAQREGKFPDQVKKLSRNHARIFYKEGKFYVEDLGSINGTMAAWKKLPVNKPTSLCNGDFLSFGQFFNYVVKLDYPESEAASPEVPKICDHTVMDTPNPDSEETRPAGSGKLKSVSEEPSPSAKTEKAGKGSPKEDRSSQSLKKETKPPRRESVSEEPVSASVKAEKAGKSSPKEDRSSQSLKKETKPPPREEILPSEPSRSVTPKEGKTQYIKDGTAFLKVFLSENKKTKQGEDTSEKDKSDAPHSPKKKTPLKIIFEAFRGKPEDARKRKWFLSAAAGIGLIVFLFGAAVMTSPEHELNEMTAQGKYKEGIEFANRILSRKPEERTLKELVTTPIFKYVLPEYKDLQTLAAEALLKDILPEWSDKLNNRLFSQALEILANTAEQTRHNPEALKSVELMIWIQDMEQYFSGRSPETPIVIFRDEIQIESLLSRWEQNKNENRRIFTFIAEQNTSFEAIQKHVYHCLDILQKWEFAYLKPIQEFKNVIKEKLNADRTDALESEINEFRRRFPGIGGLKALDEDLSHYKKILNAEKIERTTLLGQMKFQTEPFIEKAGHLRK